jgi:hypothetical protein
MRAMSSVISFTDGAITGSMDSGGPLWDACELIEVSDFDEFERDNVTGEGGVLAGLWRERLESWSISYIQEFDEPSSPQQEAGGAPRRAA